MTEPSIDTRMEAKIDQILKDVHDLKLHQNTVSTSAKIFRVITGTLLTAILSVSLYFFAITQDHEARITHNNNEVKRAIRHVEGRGHENTRDSISELWSALRELKGRLE